MKRRSKVKITLFVVVVDDGGTDKSKSWLAFFGLNSFGIPWKSLRI